MKKIIIASVLAIGLAAAAAFAHGPGYGPMGSCGQMMGPGMMGHGMMGPGMMGPGMMGPGMMGPGMMGPGMMGPGMMGPGMMGQGMMGPGMEGNCGGCPGSAGTGEGGWNSEQYRKFMDETAGLRRDMHQKRFEYMEAMRNPATTREQLSAMEKEMIDLRMQIFEKAEQTQ